MAATTTLLGLVTPTQGTLSGTWGDTVNYGITDYVDISVAGTLTLTGDGAVTLANTTGSSSGNSITSTLAGAGTVTAQFSAVRVSGTTTTKVVTGPSYSKTYLVDNASSFAVTFKASAQTGVSISPNEKVYVYYNGTDYVKVGGGGITYGAVKTTTYTAVANDGVLTNTTSAAFTVNLPATPSTGTQVFIADSAGTWGTNNLTIGRNGSTIEGSATDLVCDINSVSIQCVYNGTTWDIFAQIGANDTAVVTLNGTQTLTNKTLTSPTITGTGAIAAATVTLSSSLTLSGGTANGVTYLNGSKSVTSGSALVFDGNNLGVGTSSPAQRLDVYGTGMKVNNASYVGYLGAGNTFAGGAASDFCVRSDNVLSFATGGPYERARIDPSGNLLVGTTSLTSGGGVLQISNGITFPATQSASSNANTLDDYEEGSFTATLTCTTSGTITLGYNTLYYTKIGRQVTILGYLGVNSVSSPVGNVQLNGLPFTVLNGNIARPVLNVKTTGLAATAATAIMGELNENSTSGFIYKFSAGSVGALAGDVQASAHFVLSTTYFTT